MRTLFVLCLFFVCIQWEQVPVANAVFAEEHLFSAVPYKIKICLAPNFPVSDSEENILSAALIQRSKNQVGQLWDLTVEFSASETAALFLEQCKDPPPEWETFDKIFLAVLTQSPRELRIQEFDVKTHWTGRSQVYSVENPVKITDVLWKALIETFSPVAKLEKASPVTATLRIQGSDIFIPSAKTDGEIESSGFITETALQRAVLLPFVRSKDRNGNITDISSVPHTVLLAEQLEPQSNLLRCRLNSSLPGALTSRRRGQTEIFALSVSTPKTPTLLQLQPRLQNKAHQGEDNEQKNLVQTLPVYDVLEIVPGVAALKLLGQTKTDGAFVLEPLETSSVRAIIIRSGRSVIAKFPVVRGLEEKMFIPIPDDAVRLEAEAVLLGLQEEMIDTAARRQLLEQKLKTSQEKNDEKQIREIRTELAKLKDANRFMIELEQFKLRFHSADPIVRHRIDRLFNDTKKAVESAPPFNGRAK